MRNLTKKESEAHRRAFKKYFNAYDGLSETIHKVDKIVESFKKRVEKILGSKRKANIWMQHVNPNFGGLSPIHMIMLGKEKRVENFIKNAEEENA